MSILASFLAFVLAVTVNAIATRIWTERAPFSVFIIVSTAVFFGLSAYSVYFYSDDILDIATMLLLYAAAAEFYVLLILLVGNSVSVSILLYALDRPLSSDKLIEMYSDQSMLDMRLSRLNKMGLIASEGGCQFSITPSGYRMVNLLDRLRRFFGHGSLLPNAQNTEIPIDTVDENPPSKTSSRLLHWLALILKLALSAALLIYVYQKFGSDQLFLDLGRISLPVVAVVVSIQALQIFIGAWRMRVLTHEYGDNLDWLFSVRLTFVGFFFSQTFVSFVGGDGMRIWQMFRNGYSLRVAGHVILADRILGFLMLLAIILLGLPYALSVTDGVLRAGMALISLASVIGCLAFFYVSEMPQSWHKLNIISRVDEQSQFCRRILSKLPGFSSSFALPHVLNTAILYIFLIEYGAEINFLILLSVVPPVFLLSMLPVSFAGWGVREGALVAVLGNMGLETSVIITASISLGISHILASLPGSLLWLVDARRAVVRAAP